VRAGRCGAAPPVFRLPDGLIYVLCIILLSFLSFVVVAAALLWNG
jgi:hypothetical protein